MENLGSMDLDRLFQLFAASLAGAAVIIVLIAIYVIMSRRRDEAKIRMRLGTGNSVQATAPTASRAQVSPALQSRLPLMSSEESGGVESPGSQQPSIDVSARLAGTGREAWLVETPSDAPDAAPPEERADYHGREVLRLVRNSLTGQMWVRIAGMRYRNLNDIRDRAVGERVLAAITHVLRFSNGMLATDQGVVTLELPPCDAVRVPTAFGVLSETAEPGEIMRLMSDHDHGHFCVYVADRCYRRLVEIADRTTGQCILEAITRLLQFSNGTLATNLGVGVVPVPSLSADRHTPLPVPPAASPQVGLSTASSLAASVPAAAPSSPVSSVAPSITPSIVTPVDEQERFLQRLSSQMPSQPQAPVERPSLIGSLRRMRKKSPTESLSPLNLADEINSIFQSKLSASSSKVNAGVEANPEGGVRIRIGMAYYDSPDEVPDPNLRDMLKLSIAEWERS
jgi:hypothetical protein